MSDDVFGSASEGLSSRQDTSDLEEDVQQEELKQLNVRIPKALHQRLKVESARTETPVKDIVTEVLDSKID
jgi:predicted HicB family RNase H-like nuclease